MTAPTRSTGWVDRRRWLWAAALLAAFSLAPRLWNIDSPFVGPDEFRQTQTAITVQAMLEAPGFAFPVFTYETPVFGPPWRVPFEFPTYQLTAATIARLAPAVSADMACRVAALAWFYLSAALLFGIARRQVGTAFATVTLGLYLWSPFAIYWSRSAMIDYTSVALGLGYLGLGLLALDGRRWPNLAGAAVLGILTSATKATTWLGFAVVLGLAFLPALRSVPLRSLSLRPLIRPASSALALFVCPLAAGVAWTAWADRVKAAHEATRWLTSSEFSTWTFGRLVSRFDPEVWTTLAFVPALLAGMALVGPWLRAQRPEVWRVAWPSALAAVASASIFLNLYLVHDYYQIAVMPFLAVASTAGLWALSGLRRALRWSAYAALAVAVVPYAVLAWARFGEAMSVDWNAPSVRLGELVARVTPADRWVLVALGEHNWNPSTLYFSHRRGLMLRGRVPGEVDPRYTTLVCDACPEPLLERFPDRRLEGSEAGHRVYRLLP